MRLSWHGAARGSGARRLVEAGAVLSLAMAAAASAQELEPRAYSPNPTGAKYVLVAFGRSSGEVVFDAALPFRNVEARINSATFLCGRSFGLFGRSASVGLVLPYVWGDVEGEVFEQRRSITRSGLADGRVRLAVNLVGGPALARPEFAKRRPRSTLGASLVVAAPTGQYDPAKLINVGANRWSLKPELGFSQPAGRWMFEAYAGSWLFTDNEDFYGGQLREQAPLVTLQAHVGYTFKPRMWLAADATYYNGGRTTLDEKVNADLQQNSRLGLTFALPIGSHHSLKAAWATGFTTRVGGDFQTLSVGWQYLWF